MEILVINFEDLYIERVSLTPDEEKLFENQDNPLGFDDEYRIAEDILSKRGYYTQDPHIKWMVADDVPVFEYGESIPFFTI